NASDSSSGWWRWRRRRPNLASDTQYHAERGFGRAHESRADDRQDTLEDFAGPVPCVPEGAIVGVPALEVGDAHVLDDPAGPRHRGGATAGTLVADPGGACRRRRLHPAAHGCAAQGERTDGRDTNPDG